MIEVKEMKIPDGKTFLDTLLDFVDEIYAIKQGIALTPAFHLENENKIEMLRLMPPVANAIDLLRGDERIEADTRIKGIMLSAIFTYIKAKNPDGYIFISEMFVKKTSLEDRNMDKVKKDYKSGDARKDPNSREGVMFHYETKSSYVSRMYLLERKYEKGRVLKLMTEMTEKDNNPEPGGNFVNILYKPENHSYYGKY